MQAEYPRLDLIEKVFNDTLVRDADWQFAFENVRKKNRFALPCYTAEVFLQIWGNTGTAFDVTDRGTPTFSGQALTSAYTVVMYESCTEYYGVFVGGKLAYIVSKPTEEFYKDLQNKNMATVSKAKERY